MEMGWLLSHSCDNRSPYAGVIGLSSHGSPGRLSHRSMHYIVVCEFVIVYHLEDSHDT